eukprot:gene14356-19617_t
MAPLPVKMIFATMVTLAKTKDEKKYLRMTNNWVRQLEYHGIPRDRMLILVTSDCPQTTITAVQALGTQIVVKPPLTVVPSALDKSYHNQPSKL